MTIDRLAWFVAIPLCVVPAAVPAQGFSLNELGTCAMTRGYAATSVPCRDPSAIYWNPAGVTSLLGWSAYAGVAAVVVGGEFTADTTGRVDEGDVPVTFPPHVFVNYTSNSAKWSAGLGAYVPYGLTSQWHSDFPGRFVAQKGSLASVYIQPNVAFQFAPGWSIGGGPVFGYSHVVLRQSLDLSEQTAAPNITFGMLGIPRGTEFARTRLAGNATAWGFNVGVRGTFASDWQVGARYLSRLTFNYDDADATFAQTPTGLTLAAGNPLDAPPGTPFDALLAPTFAPGGPLVSQSVSTRIRHPSQLQVGLGYTGFTNTTLSADVEWIDYSVFNRVTVDFQGPAPDRTLLEDYKDSWSLRFGVEHAFAIGIKGRAGFSWIGTPAPNVTVTPLLPDQDRRNYSVGLGVPLGTTFTVDAGYLRVDTSGRRGRIVERTSESQTAAQLNTGFYTLDANIFSLSVRANF